MRAAAGLVTAAWRGAAWVAGLLIASLAGCAQPGPAREPRSLADARQFGATESDAPWPSPRWWAPYGDTALDRLVDAALAQQPSLQVAEARIRQAAAAAAGAEASSGPQTQLSADATLQRFTEHGLVPPALAGATRWNNNLQLGLRWDLDLFGRQRAALDAAIGRQRAAQADAEAARVELAAQVVQQYVQLARTVALRGLAGRVWQNRRQTLELVQQRVEAGLDGRAELHRAEAAVLQAAQDIDAHDEAAERQRHALAELCGQGPSSLAGLSPLLPAPRLDPAAQVLPADLLGRRADLVAQRWRVEAALHDVTLARAQFMPNLDLGAFVGLSSLGLGRWLNLGSRTAGVGPALRLPLFDAGRLRAGLDARGAELDAAIEAYNGTLLRALHEAADEIGTLQALQRLQQGDAELGHRHEALLQIARQRRQAGLGHRLAVLAAEEQLLLMHRTAIDLQARRVGAEAALARALGGGIAIGSPPRAATEPPTTLR